MSGDTGGSGGTGAAVEPALPRVQRVAAVLWPSFIMAALATAVFFGVLDPAQLLECAGEAPLSRIGAYSLAFFCFWTLGAATAAISMFFLRPGAAVAPLGHRADSSS